MKNLKYIKPLILFNKSITTMKIFLFLTALFSSMHSFTQNECFIRTTETLVEQISISFSEGNQVSGYLWGDITDEENGYYAQYTGEINGTIIGNKLNITITTEIEGYSEENTETWVLKNEWTLIRNNNYFKLIECRD